jgi:hypothetical protein
MDTTTPTGVNTKVCKKCGRELPLDRFHTDSRMRDGHKNHCKDCLADYAKSRKGKKEIAFAPKVSESVTKELEQNHLETIPSRLLIHELRRRGYRGKLELVTIQEVVI